MCQVRRGGIILPVVRVATRHSFLKPRVVDENRHKKRCSVLTEISRLSEKVKNPMQTVFMKRRIGVGTHLLPVRVCAHPNAERTAVSVVAQLLTLK